ncbi:MAG: helix-turn-helix transcriptional regulator, partial [Lachnospiraceae bacterium]|nr:helix-turn-helix transcriptional regulator [Lachnospiraceae bacterium]
MIDLKKTGAQIAALRRARGYTGEALAEKLHISPQAVSKWENAKCLPETAILPALAEALDCSIDSLLYPRELFILEAVYTDGKTHIPVTNFVNNMVRDNTLNIFINAAFIGACLESDRLKLMTVKFQTPKGIFFACALQNENLVLDKESVGFAGDRPFQLIGAWYGDEREYSCVMQKMKHYEYFKWDRIAVNHESFPSSTASDNTEYLTLVYLNSDGIHAISCPENNTIYYNNHRTQLLLQDHSKCILRDIIRLSWEEGPTQHGQMCPWAGSLHAALKYMGEPYTYHQIMGMSGACYRICFTDVWDYSCTDALVAFDYATPLYKSIGYSFRVAERLEKEARAAERLAIMTDIQNGRPVLAINLRVAPEWGVITGYTDNGSRFLCRTYFDQEVFTAMEQADYPNPEDRRMIFEDNGGYLFNDFW